MTIFSRFYLAGFLLLGCLASDVEAVDAIDFNRDIRPILSRNCAACHGADEKKREAGLRIDVRESAIAPHDGHQAIAPGDPKKSELIRRITSTDADERMPPQSSGKKLTSQEIDLLTRWIKQGAPYTPHWAYVKPVRPTVPAVNDKAWPKNELDRFLLARLEKEKLRPAPEADRYALARRLTLDLTGLPPTIEEVDRFVRDESAKAFEDLVDALLARETFGEHWARMWLDQARYADSGGYVSDVPREIWAFRDYVIRSLNANKPFDQFTIEQLAGDLLPNPSEEQIVATAFHRNTQTNTEGGSDREEYRNVAIVDRVNTTMAVWMGTTMACAQCHDHKYDPISQKEYFQFFAILNNTEDADRADEAPVHSFYTDARKQQRAKLQAEVSALEPKVPASEKTVTPEPKAMKKKGPAKAKPSTKEKAKDKDAAIEPTISEEGKRLARLKARLDAIKPYTVPIQRELPSARGRTTTIQFRGNFLDRGPVVTPGLPAAFSPNPAQAGHDVRTVSGEGAGVRAAPQLNRLGLAQWLVDEENPLVARVIVNRLWEKLFGNGLVLTSEDFGTQGDLPSHPELLDYLATELIARHWDLKSMIRLMVTTAAYRQSSSMTAEMRERDPDNRLLARGPRFRLDAEAVRDQALAVAGLLSAKMYGPSVRPLQPSFGLSTAFGHGMDWTTSEGEDRFRRAIYTSWHRTNPYPSMATFDSPSREVCAIRRPRTNTPLQALVTLNDPVYVEAAQALGRRIDREGGKTVAEKVRYGFRLCVARAATEPETERLTKLFEQSRARFSKNLADAKKLATEPLGPLPPGADPVQLAAWTAVGNVLLNLDESLMRP